MRRVGKSTAVKYILQRVAHSNYLYLDCERIEIRVLFNGANYEDIKDELGLMGLDFSKSAVIALDEIQLVENLPSVIKYLYDTYDINIDKEISQQTKLYFADTGILNILAGEQLSSGQIFENAIAIQLKNQGKIQYYQKKTGQGIDFILNGDTALEVKETPIQQDKQTLEQRTLAIDINKYFVVGRKHSNNGFSDFIWGGNIF